MIWFILQALEELKGTGQQQRFDRLQTLLNRSNLYATYLLQRIKDREISDKKNKERKDKKKEEKKLNSSSQESSQDKYQNKVGLFKGELQAKKICLTSPFFFVLNKDCKSYKKVALAIEI